MESWKNPDRMNRGVHVDRVCVQSTFVYVYDELRVDDLCYQPFSFLTWLFFSRKVEHATTISKLLSRISVRIIDRTLRDPHKTITLFF